MSHIRNPRPADPFDGSAPARLARMGLLTADGAPNPATLPVYAGIFTADFFDAITDFYDDSRVLRGICEAFAEYRARREYELEENPTTDTERPEVLTPDARVLDPDEMQIFMKEVVRETQRVAILFDLFMGLRATRALRLRGQM